MKSIGILMMLLAITASCNNNIKNARTEIAMVAGNCAMCKDKIESAGFEKGVSTIKWDVDTKLASITFDSNKTNKEALLKKIALAGYDNDSFKAPEESYNNLHGCCQYDRKTATSVEKIPKNEVVVDNKAEEAQKHKTHNNSNVQQNNTKDEKQKSNTPKVEISKTSSFQDIYNNYFLLKNSLVSTNGVEASNNAKKLLSSLKAIDMNKLKTDEHVVWMKVYKALIKDAELISETKDVGHQRDYFISLSTHIYELMKVSKNDTEAYYQHCPMANDGKGANWLSTEAGITNPYYGSQMLTCGKVIEKL